MENSINVATVFSGIGSIEFALKRLGIKSNIVFACDNGEREITYNKDLELDIVRNIKTPLEQKIYVDKLYDSKTRKHNFVQDTYEANYSIDNGLFFQDICLLDGSNFKGKVDLFVGGSPCQSFSSVGYQKGLEDTRGTLFYEFARLVKEIQPNVFIYENVKNMINHDKGNTWSIINNVFQSLGYNIDHRILNSIDFGIPQNRNRLFVVGIRKDLNIIPNIPISKNKFINYNMQDFLLNNCRYGDFTYNTKTGELIIKKSQGIIGERYYLSEAVKNYVLKEGTKTWKQKVKTDLPIARTLLKTMGNCHRAGVDNYITLDGRIRMLTEREALRLMGYTDDFKIVTSVAQVYKQAGNSIVVDIMMELVKYLKEIRAL